MEVKNKRAHDRSGLHSVLSNPYFFDTFQKLLGLSRCKRRYVGIINPIRGAKILDIGCGTADVLEHLPADIEYHGYDLQPEYITYAQNKFKARGRFFCADVASLNIQEPEKFDLVMVNDIVHHLTPEEARRVFQIARACLKEKGSLATIDIIKTPGQSWLARYLMSKDRGQMVRTRDEYISLVKEFFNVQEEYILQNMYYVPYTNIVIKAGKK